MHIAKVATMATALLAVALAGCTSGSSPTGGFSIKGPDASGAYTFTASGSADNYTWDLGDHLTLAFGKSATHTYDFANGVLPIVLTTTKGGATQEHRKELTLGTGQNGNAAFVLEGESNWTVTNQSVSFSARGSTDPDGDPLRYAWSCQRTGDAVRQAVHSHGGSGGVPFATAPAGAVVSRNAQGLLPAADRAYDGDLCDALGTGGRPTKDTTISGTFTRPGKYDVYLLASDPVHPSTSGKYSLVVTNPQDKPAEIQAFAFNGTFTAGSGGVIQGVCAELDNCIASFDEVVHTFRLDLLGQAGYASLGYDDPTGTMQISCRIQRGTADIDTATGPDANVTLDPTTLLASTYTATCQPQVGAPTSADGTPYTLTVVVDLDLDPSKIY